MNNPETQTILSKRHKMKTKKNQKQTPPKNWGR